MTPKRNSEFNNRPILAIDYGSKVIGLAKFTPGVDPFPLIVERIIVKNEEQVMKELANTITEESIEIVVIGVPYLIDGTVTDQSKKCFEFKNKLEKHFKDITFFTQDETLTTKEATERMKNSPAYNYKVDLTKIDSVSAVIILEDFLNNH